MTTTYPVRTAKGMSVQAWAKSQLLAMSNAMAGYNDGAREIYQTAHAIAITGSNGDDEDLA